MPSAQVAADRTDWPAMKASRKGLTTKARILRAALDVLVEHGYANLTIKAVADKAGIAYGNLTYHYPAKETLIGGMLELWLEDYKQELDQLLRKALKTSDSPLPTLVEWLVEDAMTKQTARTFTELWAMSNQDPKTAKVVNQLYDDAIESFMSALGVDPQDRAAREFRSALYFFAVVTEGSSAIFGNRPKTHPQAKAVRHIAQTVLVPLLESALARARR